MLQMGRCSFDLHVQEIFGSITSGATLIMLRPRGTMDLQYLSRIMKNKEITYMSTVPSLLYRFCTFLEDVNNFRAFMTLRSLCSSGKQIPTKLIL